MPGKFSFVTLYDGRHITVSRERGEKMQKMLDCELKPQNQQQADYLLNIKSIYPLRPYKAVQPEVSYVDQYWASLDQKAEQTEPQSVTDDSDLYHPGVLQSKDMALPENDR